LFKEENLTEKEKREDSFNITLDNNCFWILLHLTHHLSSTIPKFHSLKRKKKKIRSIATLSSITTSSMLPFIHHLNDNTKVRGGRCGSLMAGRWMEEDKGSEEVGEEWALAMRYCQF